MIKLLLIHPPFGTGNDKRPPDIFDPHFPWGLGYIAGVLKKDGWDIDVFDIYANQWNREEAIKKLEVKSFDYVLITAMATQYSYIKWLAEKIKKINRDCRIIIGGPLATFSYEVVLKNTSVDICVIGEGENTISDLMNRIDNLKHINGIVFKDSQGITKTESRPLIKDIDALPSPPYELFRMDIYRTNKLYIHNKSMRLYSNIERPYVMAIISGRGCPFNCNFCSRTFKTIRIRSVESIIREIDFFKKVYGIRGINFVDELLFLKKDMINHLAEELGKRGMLWNGQARIDTIDCNMLPFYKKNGLVSIGYGIESGSDFILGKMNKGINVKEIEKVLRKTIDAGLHLKVQLIYGYPGESCETINDTVELFKRAKHPGRRFSILTPLPGSQVYDMAKEKGLIKSEDEYLSNIYEGFWRKAINMTDFNDEEFEYIRKNTEQRMRDNYKQHLSKLSPEERDAVSLLCEEDFEKEFINKPK